MINEKEIYIEPIMRCNLNCKMCYTVQSKNELSQETILWFINSVDVDKIYWCGGGEVFLYRQFINIVNMFPDKKHTIMTNGTIDKIDRFDKHDNLSFRVSIDGNEEFHDNNRGRGTYKKSLAFCKKLRALNIPVEIRTLSQDISDELKSIGDVTYTEPYANDDLRDIITPNIKNNLGYSRVARDTFIEPETYLSLNCNGIYSCCEGIIKVAEIGDDSLMERLRMASTKCKHCPLFGKCM